MRRVIIRAPGTDNAHRDRHCVVSPWAWLYVEQALDGKIGPATKVFSLDYKRAVDAFYDAQVAAAMRSRQTTQKANP